MIVMGNWTLTQRMVVMVNWTLTLRMVVIDNWTLTQRMVIIDRPPYDLEVWVGVGKGMLPVKYFHSLQSLFFMSVEFHETVKKLR